MRFLADAGISPQTVTFLETLKHETEHVRVLGMHRATDRDVLTYARTHNQVVLTFDLDFGEILAAAAVQAPSVIIFRLSDQRPVNVNRQLAVVLVECAAELEMGALVLVEEHRYRLRKLPIGRS
jgi:predicted nuclease of predicted toxin-antitoxin system